VSNGCGFMFPPRLAQGLEDGTDAQLAQVVVLGRGGGLYWEALDSDLSVPGLLAGLLGSRATLARQAGRTTSAAKGAVARRNGPKGGRGGRWVRGEGGREAGEGAGGAHRSAVWRGRLPR
jgi:hypothetical protein